MSSDKTYLDSFSVTCASGFPSIGYQPGERTATVVRVICTFLTVSILSSWRKKRIVGRYLLFFTQWLSGLLHQLAEMVLAEMVSMCWTKANVLRHVQALKFVELVAGNMLAATNLAICVNLAVIVSSNRTMARVNSIASCRLILGLLVVSAAAALAAACFWETLTISGTLFWSVNRDEDQHIWVLTSTFLTELLAGAAMLVIGTLLLIFRRPELRKAWRIHRRVQCYIILACIACVSDLAIGMGGIAFVLHEQYKATLIVATWTMRHVQIALNALVLYSVLGGTTELNEHEVVTKTGLSAAQRRGFRSSGQINRINQNPNPSHNDHAGVPNPSLGDLGTTLR